MNMRERTHVGGTRAPAHSEDTVVASAVTEAVGPLDSGSGIITDDDNAAWFVERESTSILEQNGAGGTDLAHDLEVVVLNVNVCVITVQVVERIERNYKKH